MKDKKIDNDFRRLDKDADARFDFIEIDDADLDKVIGIGNDYARSLDYRNLQR